MTAVATSTRPNLEEALEAWKKILAERGFATDLLWVFEENLCLERQRAEQGGFHFAFQTRFTPPSDDALDIAYDHFCEMNSRVVFYRLGGAPGKSVCILLCDPWFEKKGDAEGFLRRDDWRVSFYPGLDDQTEEVTDLSRWLRRVKRDRAFHELDFCMTLAAVEEIRVYGRPLLHYERFAESMIKHMRQFLGQAA
jgi:uncharacterized protein YciU (UPF0263 family)